MQAIRLIPSWLIHLCGLLLLLSCCAHVSNAQDGATPQRGFHLGGSYALSNIETINTANGNLMFRIPLASLPSGRGSSPGAGITLIYNSKLWDVQNQKHQDPLGNQETKNVLTHSTEGGWRYAFGYEVKLFNRLEQYDEATMPDCTDLESHNKWKLKVRFPDGGLHEFRPQGYTDTLADDYFMIMPDGWIRNCGTYYVSNYGTMVYYSTDGSYTRLEVQHDGDAYDWQNNPWTLYFPDGSRVTGGNAPQRIYDRNNNYTEIQEITYNNNPASKIVDQMGRYLILERGYDQDTIYSWGFNNEELRTVVQWKSVGVIKTYYAGGEYTPPQGLATTFGAVERITLPAQVGSLTYTFGYNTDSGGNPTNGWGEVNSVTLPSGARATYQYSQDARSLVLYSEVMNNAPTRKDLTYNLQYDGSATPVTETWLYDFNPGYTCRITGPDGGVLKETSDLARGVSISTERSDGTKVERRWLDNIPSGVRALPTGVNPYVKTEYTSVKDTASNYFKTAIKDYNYDKNGNVTQVAEYDWVAYSAVQRVGGLPIGIPAGAVLKRLSTNSYYVQTPDASNSTTNDPDTYHLVTAPKLCRAVAATEVSDGAQTLARAEFFYDNYATTGNLIQQKSWDSTRGSYSNPLTVTNSVNVSHQYDGHGNRVLSTDTRGIQTQVTYGPVGGFAGLYPTEIKQAAGRPEQRTSQQEYDFSTGLVVRSTDVDNEVATATNYDAVGRPILVRAALGKPEETRTQTIYSDAARRVVVRADLNVAGDGKLVTVQHYDEMGRVRLTRQLEDAATQSETDETTGIKVQTRYLTDAANHFTYQLVSNPYRAAYSSGASTETTTGWARTTSDNSGRLIEAQTFAGSGLPAPWGNNTSSTGAVTTAYDGSATTVKDQANKSRRSEVDGLGRLTSVIEDPNGLNYQTGYHYDALGNLRQVTQGQQTRTFAYDSLSRLTAAQNPESGAVNYQYDNNGNLAQKTDARGITTTYAYDALNRVTGRSYSDGTPTVSYKYDTAGILNSKGRLTQVSSSVSVTSYAGFDALGRVTASSQATDGHSYALSYEYDLAGHLKREIYPTGRVIQHSFDAAGRLQQVTGTKGNSAPLAYATIGAYTAHGAAQQVTLGNSLVEQTSFNSRRQPEAIKLGSSTNPTDKLWLQYSYGTTANNGNVQAQTISVPGLPQPIVQTYQYDSLNRLSQARETSNGAQSWQQVYTYDRYGNRTLAAGTSIPASPDITQDAANNPSVNPATNRFNSGQGYAYDNGASNSAGNLTAAPGYTYSYDAENRIVVSNYASPNQQGTPNSYAYDGDGRRVKKVTANGQETTVFVYNAMGQMVCEYNNLLPATVSETSYLTSDTLGTPRVITKTNGGVKARHDYLPFGEELFAGTGGRTGSGQQQYPALDDEKDVRQKFTGKERDRETGLDYFLARYYSSAQGRFTSPDDFSGGAVEVFAAVASANPTFYADITNPQTLNKYQYCLNNPSRYIDPYGHQQEDDGNWLSRWLGSLVRNLLGQVNPEAGAYEEQPRGPLTVNRDKVVGTVSETFGRGMETAYDTLDSTGLDFGANKLLRSMAQGDKEGSAIAAVFFVANVATLGKGEKAVVVGERMATRVIPVAEEIGARYYQPTSKVAENWLANNTKWIQRQIASGNRIFDIGAEGARVSSKYYQREVEQLTKAGLQRVERGSVEIKGQTFKLFEWIRQ